MRISEQRYTRDRRALDVAARLIDFEARTGTIRELTGLADGSIRSLSKACGIDSRSPKLRHRGASPRKVNNLLGKARPRNEAAALLGLCQLMGLDRHEPGPDRMLNRVSRAERLCDAYWTFRFVLPEATISFEHMLLLLSEAAKGEELATTHCPDCKALQVVDRLSLLQRDRCQHCTADALGWHDPDDFTRLRKVAEEPTAYR